MLTKSQLASFEQSGFVSSELRISDDIIAGLRTEVLRLLDEPSICEGQSGTTKTTISRSSDSEAANLKMSNVRLASTHFFSMATNEGIAEEVSQLMKGGSVRVWKDQLISKPAGTGPPVGWHQDAIYWPLLSDQSQVTAWIPFDDTTSESGCLCLVRGSHLWGDQAAAWREFKTFNSLPTFFNGHSLEPRSADLRKGQVHYHHALTWHGSHANHSAIERVAFAIHYMSSTTRHKDGTRLSESLEFPVVWPSGAGGAAF